MGHQEFRDLRRFPALDGLRGIAALMVVAFHYGGPTLGPLSGWLGVQLFFVLSGFLITTLALREEDRTGRLSFTGFYVRRLFRIVPVYLTVLLAVLALDVLRGAYAAGVGPHLWWYLTFNVEWLPEPVPFGQAWTLGIEEKFYLVWPLVAFGSGALVLRRRMARLGLLVAALLALLLVTTDAVYYLEILMGCALALLMHSPRAYRWVAPLTTPAAGVAAAVASVAVQLATGWLTERTGAIFTASVLYALAITALIPSLLRPSRAVDLLGSRPVSWVGQRSYALYLVQGIAAMVVVGLVPSLGVHRVLTFVAVSLVGLAIADLLGRWVEQPCIDAGRRILARRAARASAASPAATGPSAPVAATPAPRGPLPDELSRA